jgi:hypothetical protein
MSALDRMQRRAHATPGWLRGLLIGGAFVVPILLVPGDDNLFDWTLAWLGRVFGPDAPYRHVAAYLLCVMALLVPAGVVLQLYGARRLRDSDRG